MKLLGFGIAIIATGCSFNGKAIGPQLSTSSSSASSSASSASSSSGSTSAGSLVGASEGGSSEHKLPPYASVPADPWSAVDGDQPKRWSKDAADHWTVRNTDGDCTAAHDHCLDNDVWFLVRDLEIDRGPISVATVHAFGPDDMASPWNSHDERLGDPYTAFRTVPATKTNLAVGSIVIGLSRTTTKLGSEQQAVDTYWSYGTVESVDFDVGTYKLKGANDTAKLIFARVAVLSWRPSEKVKILGGKKRDQLVVKVSDVFLPDK